MRRSAGFTLPELLISAALLSVLLASLFGNLTTQQRAYAVVDNVTEMQQAGRSLADLLERDLRGAGLLVPESASVCGVDNTGSPDVFFVSDADAITPGTEKAANFGADLPAATTNLAGAGSNTLSLDGLFAEPTPPTRMAYDTDDDGAVDSDFRVGAGVIVTDLLNPGRGTSCGVVTALSLGANTVTANFVTGALGATANPVDLVAVPAHVYQLGNDRRLRRDGQLLAEDVEDLQVAYFVDADGDRVIDAGEYRGDGAAAAYVATAVDGSQIREVRANVVLRTRQPDRDFKRGQFQQAENRAAVAGADGYRRRVVTARVLLRNVGNR